jgi:WD40 repeat protein
VATFFISHSIHDREKVEWLLRRLRGWGYESLYLHSDPENGIAVGEQWERGLYRQMHLADAVLYVESRASAESRWCFAELALARSANKPIFPVAIERGARMPLLEDRQSLDLTDGEAALERLRRALRERFDPREIFSWDVRRAPYPGLAAFEAADAAIFFGRDDTVEELLGHLDATLRRGRCIAVIGASGSGKSSLVRAGLLPRLGRVRERWVVVPPLTPGERPVGALARALAAALSASGRLIDRRELQQRIERDRAQFVEVLRDLAAGDDGRQRSVLLVIDQAEELVVLADARERARFVQLLRDGLGADSPLWVAATLRSEFLSASLRDEALVGLIDESVLLGPLGRSRFAEVIVGPAAKAGLQFAPGLVERMVEDTRGGDALPLLAYTLRELYDRERPDPNLVSNDDYDAIGGVLGALRRRADLVAEQLTRDGHGERVLPTLLRLVTVDTEGEPARRRLPRSALDATERAIVQAFVNARLVVSYQQGGQAVIDVAHEALLRSWGPLNDAIVAAQDRLRLRSQLDQDAREWLRVGGLDSYLLRGERLMRARQAFSAPAAGTAAPVEATIEEFYRSSEELETRERAVVARRRRRVVLGLSLGLALISITAAGFFWQSQRAGNQTRIAEGEARIADARRVAALALVDEGEPDRSALLALEAYRLSDIADARDALLTQLPRILQTRAVARVSSVPLGVWLEGGGRSFASITANGTLITWEARASAPRSFRLRGQPLPVANAAFSARAGLVATAAADDHLVRLWDLRTRRQIGPALRGHTGTILGLAFDPDGHVLASASADRTVRLWDVRKQRQIGTPLAGHTGRVHAVAFSPGGDTVASGGFDRTVRLWDVRTHRQTGRALRGHTGVVLSVGFARDGTTVASGSADHTVRLWNTRTHRQLGAPLRGQADAVLAVAFSLDGRFLASGGEDRAVRLWDRATHAQISSPFRGHTERVVGVAFSDDGRTLVSASDDRTLRTWDRNVGLPIRGHKGPVFGAAFLGVTPFVATAADSTIRVWNANTRVLAWRVRADRTGRVLSLASTRTGHLLASGGIDGQVHLWNTVHRVEVRPALRGHQTPVESVAMSPDGRTVASAGDDRTIRLWDVRTHRQIGSPLSGHTDVTSVSFDGTDRSLVSGSIDGTVRLWDVRSRRELGRPMRGHSGPVTSVAFSDDGETIASASTDRTIRLWNAVTRRPVGRPLRGHSDAVLSVAFAPGGKLLASGGADDSVRVWDAQSRQPLAPALRGHTDDVIAIRFSRDGRRLASGGADRTARLWDSLLWTTEWSVLRRAVCVRLARNLTRDEWKEAFPGRGYRTTCPTGHR